MARALFDDGAVSYYYRSAPWERLATAGKAGQAGRLIAFNPWELPSPTEFQDYFCGEGNVDPSMGGLVAIGGNGRISRGSHQGLQACATLIAEQDWVHARKDTDIGPPKWDESQLAALLKEFISRKNVPIFNLEIYQEGTAVGKERGTLLASRLPSSPSPLMAALPMKLETTMKSADLLVWLLVMPSLPATIFAADSVASAVTVNHLRCEYQQDPLGSRW